MKPAANVLADLADIMDNLALQSRDLRAELIHAELAVRFRTLMARHLCATETAAAYLRDLLRRAAAPQLPCRREGGQT